MKKNTALIILLIVAVVLAFWWFVKSGYKFPQQTAEAPAMENTNDLDTAAKELDGENVNQIDSELDQLNTESSF